MKQLIDWYGFLKQNKIWREIEVPSSLRLTALAVHIQNVMGWEFEHMHNIQKGNKYYCTTSMEYADGDLDGSKYSVKDLLKKVGDSMLFTYDFGVDRFITHASIEEQILQLKDRKKSLVDAVLPFLMKR